MRSPSRRTPVRQACRVLALLTTAVLVAACGKSEPTVELGKGSAEVTGSAGPAGARDASGSLTTCEAPVATVSLVERPQGYGSVLGRYGLPESPLPLLRVIVQQSNCFRIVDRHAGLNSAVREQELKDQGVVRQDGHTVARGKGYEAQYTIVPSLSFSETDAGRSIAGVLAAMPVIRDFAALIGLVEQAKFKEAQTVLLLTDNETTEQLAAATGSARGTDFGVGGLIAGRLGGAGNLGWSHTNEGKIIAAAFLDAHNKLVTQVRALAPRPLPPPSRPAGSPAAPRAARP